MAIVLSAGSDFIGPESFFVYEEPDVTSYSAESISVPFITRELNFGQYALCRVPKKDDFIKHIYLKTTLGPLFTGNKSGYVYAGPDPDTAIYNAAGTLIAQGVNTLGFYNTQLLNVWLDTTINIQLIGLNFVFPGVSLYFYSESAASFWGFDISISESRDTDPYYLFSNATKGSLNLIQSGWVHGFQPPPVSGFSYYPSVGDLVVRQATLFIGNQTITDVYGQTMIIEDDIMVPLENRAGLTITVGKGDTSPALSERTYWTKIPMDDIPISSLYNQTIQIGVQFEEFKNLTNFVSGGITNPSAYSLYTSISSTGITPYYTLSAPEGLVVVGSSGVAYISSNGVVQSDYQYVRSSRPTMFGSELYLLISEDSDTAYLSVYQDITGRGLGDLIISEYDCSGLGEGTPSLLAMTRFIWLIYENIIVYFNLKQDINNPAAYHSQTLPPSFIMNQNTAVTIGRYIYVSTTDGSILSIDTQQILDGTESPSMYKTLHMPAAFSPTNRPATDGSYLYYTDVKFYKVNIGLDSIQTYTVPGFTGGEPFLYDGTYVYYKDYYASLVFYNTTQSFTSPSSWTTFSTANNYTSGILGPTYVYFFESGGNVYKLNQFTATPSLKSEFIFEYSKLEQSTTNSLSLVNQNLLNTFYIQPGNTKSVFTLNFKGPIREFWLKSTVAINKATLTLNGEILFNEDYSSLVNLRTFESHIITPVDELYTYSIAIYPNMLTPTGSLNISRIGSSILTVYTHAQPTQQTVTMWARSINVLECNGGLGGLVFN
jgi:hypothetical protein